MSTWDAVDHYYSGQGVVMGAERDAQGNPKGFEAFGNVSDLKISVATSVTEHKESHTGQRGTDKRLTTETKCTFSMTLENFVASNLASALRGSKTTVTTGSVVDAPIKVYLGKVTALPHIKISAVSIEDGVTPLVLGTDYWVNESAGSIKFAAAIADVVDGDELTISYTYAEHFKVDALTEAVKEMSLRFEGLNTAEDNAPVIVEIFKINTDPLQELALISDNIQQIVLEGSVLLDATKTEGSKYFRALQTV